MSRSFSVLTILAVGMLAWMALPAYSTVLTTYTDLTSWQAATSGDQLADFEGLAPAGSGTVYTSPITNYPGVQFIGYTSSGSPYIQVIDSTASFFSYANFGTGDVLLEPMNPPTSSSPWPFIHVHFATPVTAFGTDLFTSSPYAATYQITLLGNVFAAATNNKPTTAFWGVTSDTPITDADFTLTGVAWNSGAQALMDNFRYGTAQAPPPPPPDDNPEAATMLMIGSGLVGLVYLRKRMHKARPV